MSVPALPPAAPEPAPPSSDDADGAVPARHGAGRAAVGGRGAALVAVALLTLALVAASVIRGLGLREVAGSDPSGPSPYAYPTVAAAPALDLIDAADRPFDLARLRGRPVLIFFGYTHCPDVCPATIGQLNEVLARTSAPLAVVFATVDPERDTPAFLREYLKYMPEGYIALTGTATQVRTVADAWGVRYARVDTGSADGYAMSHTAEVYLVDPQGMLRAHYPFGTEAPVMLEDLDRLAREATG